MQRLGPGYRVTDTYGRRQRLRIGDTAIFAALAPEFVERRRAFGLDHGQARHFSDKSEIAEFAQCFAESGRVAEIAAGQDDPVRRIPVALVQHFEDDRFLALDAKRVDGVEQVDAEAIGQGPHERENLVEVGFHLKRAGAVFERLREFAVRDIAVRDENDGIEAGGAGVRGHGRRGVARGNAGYAFASQPERLRHTAGHAVVFERAGGIETLMLEGEAIETAVLSSGGCIEQRRIAFAQRHDAAFLAIERQKLAITPDAALIERLITSPSLPPHFLPGGSFGVTEEANFEQTSALRAVIDHFSNVKARPTFLLEARQLG